MTPVDREVIKEYLGDNTTEVKNSITTAKQEILAKVKEAADAGSSSGGVQTFTTNGTFTVPAGVTKILVTACAGGQGGDYSSSSGSYYYGGKGGNGGECIIREPYTVSPGQKISITIGKGGGAGSNGIPTIIGSLVTLRGGGTATGLVGAGVGGEGGFFYRESSSNRGAEYGLDGARGNGGTVADRSVRSTPNGGGGGGSYGCGGDGADSSVNAATPGYGGGGGGGSYYNTIPSAGGDGIVIIEW